MTEFTVIKHAPFVEVVAVTQPVMSGYEDYQEYRDVTWNTPTDITGDPEAVIESAGRGCYQSWDNKRGQDRSEYIQNSLIGVQHGSVLAHASATLLVADVPRSVQLEQVRHAVGYGYSWESQRFVDGPLRFVMPPLYRGDELMERDYTHWCAIQADMYDVHLNNAYRIIKDKGLYKGNKTLQRKRAREAARAKLTNDIGSDGHVTLNARAMRHLIEMRTDEAADLSMREFAYQIYLALMPFFPGVFGDAVSVGVEFGVPQVDFKHGGKV